MKYRPGFIAKALRSKTQDAVQIYTDMSLALEAKQNKTKKQKVT